MKKVYHSFMLIIYNLLQIALGVLLLPVLLAVVLFTPKYREAVPLRLGFGLAALLRGLEPGRPRIWLHALSVGEVSSARALVRGLKEKYPDAVLIFSASTGAGREYAASVLSEYSDLLVPFPLDFLGSVERFIRLIRPDLFVLIETDLWPNFLAALKRHEVPALLLNGRISEESFLKYRRFGFFFRPLFESFRYISMQTAADAEKIRQLGVEGNRLLNLGNLKYGVLAGTAASDDDKKGPEEIAFGPGRKPLWVAGSTHSGEEEVILRVFKGLRAEFPDLYLVIAPRNIDRAGEIAALADGLGFKPVRRSEGSGFDGDLLILDTLGELAGVYREGDFAFIGGSLVRERGHNPLEPAVFGKPVLFGPHMEDFAEIADDLLKAGGAVRVADEEGLASIIGKWLAGDELRRTAGESAAGLVAAQRGVTEKHVALLGRVIDEGRKR